MDGITAGLQEQIKNDLLENAIDLIVLQLQKVLDGIAVIWFCKSFN